MSGPAPVGLFDSGLGGLSVLREVRALLPGADLLYVADTQHCPYGPRPYTQIRSFSLAISRALLEAGAEVLVVACNTASAAALRWLREQLPEVPMVGMVPPLKPAASLSRQRLVGVLATPGTLQGDLFREVREQYASGVLVLPAICEGLVEAVEAGELEGPQLRQRLAASLAPLTAGGMDTLVLGCTHYPFLRPLLEEILGPEVTILDSGQAVARQVARVLGAGAASAGSGGARFYTSGDAATFRRRLGQLLGLREPWVGRARWTRGRVELLPA